MALLPRALQKIFGLTGAAGEFGKIGSKAAGAPVTTKDLELMQSLSEYSLGLPAIVSDQGTSVLPYLEDINSLFFLTTSQIAYLMQSGVAEWNDETEYYLGISVVLENGMLWIDTFGTGGTPNVNNQPSTNPDKWKRAAAPERSEFSSKDLIINVQSNTTVDADAKRLSLLDSNFIPKFIDDLDVTFTMPTDLEAGTTEKSSHWYGLWTDSDDVQRLVPDLTGTTDSTVAGSIADSGATWLTDLVHDGDIVYNLTTLQKTKASADAAAQGQFTLEDDIFLSGNGYKIVKMSPEGIGPNGERLGEAFNNGSSNFDDSTYAQPQDPKFYSEAAGDFTFTATNWTTDEAELSVRQINDWTGLGRWKINFNFDGDFSSGNLAGVNHTISGILSASYRQPVTVYDSNLSVRAADQYSQARITESSALLSLTIASIIDISLAAWSYSGDFFAANKPTFHS